MRQLDARGLICPLPVLKARKILLSMQAGERLEVLATDANAPKDFVLYCQESGHRLVERHSENGHFRILVECSSA